MTEPLYFMPYLVEALQGLTNEISLKDSLGQIIRKGVEEHNTEGLRNFALFMAEVHSQHDILSTDYIRELIAGLATGTFEATERDAEKLIEAISSHPEWNAEYEAFCHQVCEDTGQALLPAIQLFCRGQLISEVLIDKAETSKRIDGIIPGQYMIKLDIGQVIWEGQLSAKDLLWAEAFEARDLDLAAETAGLQQQPTRQIVLLDGALIMRVFAAIESGSIEIELNGKRHST